MEGELRHWDINSNAERIDKFWRENVSEASLYQRMAGLIIDTVGRGEEVFEVGCGSGMNYEYLKGEVQYRCGDVSEEFRKLMKKRYPELDPIPLDIHQLPFEDEEISNTINISVLQHLPYYEKPIQELVRVAREKIIVVTWGTQKNRKKDILKTDSGGTLNGKVLTSTFHHNYYNIPKLVEFCKSLPKVSQVNSYYLWGPVCWIYIKK